MYKNGNVLLFVMLLTAVFHILSCGRQRNTEHTTETGAEETTEQDEGLTSSHKGFPFANVENIYALNSNFPDYINIRDYRGQIVSPVRLLAIHKNFFLVDFETLGDEVITYVGSFDYLGQPINTKAVAFNAEFSWWNESLVFVNTNNFRVNRTVFNRVLDEEIGEYVSGDVIERNEVFHYSISPEGNISLVKSPKTVTDYFALLPMEFFVLSDGGSPSGNLLRDWGALHERVFDNQGGYVKVAGGLFEMALYSIESGEKLLTINIQQNDMCNRHCVQYILKPKILDTAILRHDYDKKEYVYAVEFEDVKETVLPGFELAIFEDPAAWKQVKQYTICMEPPQKGTTLRFYAEIGECGNDDLQEGLNLNTTPVNLSWNRKTGKFELL